MNALVIENENNLLKALDSGINLFVGSGFSTLARDANRKSLPSGSKLKDELIQHFGRKDLEPLNLSQLCAILQTTRRADMRKFLTDRFTVATFDPSYLALERVEIKTIFTTNIDDLIFKLYAKSTNHYVNHVDLRGAAPFDRRAVELVTLHGSVTDPTRAYEFGTLDIASAAARHPDRWTYLRKQLGEIPTLWWGYGVEDSGTLGALYSDVGGATNVDKWILLRDPAPPTVEYFRALGFQIILGDTVQMLTRLGAIVSATPAAAVGTSIVTIGLIPAPGSVPVRPLSDFALGAEPSWYDVSSRKIHMLESNRTIRDHINAGKTTIIIGIPASGKSTLLMQVAWELDFAGRKLFLASPTAEQAEFILNQLRGTRAVVFVDNFTDDIAAFNILVAAPNVQVVAADREYNYEMIFHRLSGHGFAVVDISAVTDVDLQAIYDRMPAELRSTSAMVTPKMGPDLSVSVFEFVDANIRGNGLRQRFTQVLSELKKTPQLLAFLLACCYVDWCRSRMSMDMLLAFFREEISSIDYKRIYTIRDQLGTILADYDVPSDAAGDQDYFGPRSAIVSATVLSAASQPQLHSVVTRFHENLSPTRIYRYDVFKRRAYDADFMLRVFARAEDGEAFYKKIYEITESPYIQQHAALFLAKFRRFDSAFGLIDAALQSSRSVPSIQNSHAKILFEANINRDPRNPTVRRTLEQSMNILAKCVEDDRRKAYHVTTYADQALRFSSRYGRDDVEAIDYLGTARQWLVKEAVIAPWNRSVRELRKLVERRMEQFGIPLEFEGDGVGRSIGA